MNYIQAYRKGLKERKLIKKTFKEQKYYSHIDELPVFNFFQIWKGKYEYLWKNEADRQKKYPKALFIYVFREMGFQFKKLDNSYLRDKADLADYESKYVRTGEMRWKNEYNTLKKKIETKDSDKTPPDLDDFTDFIERTFDNPVGSLDVYRVSTSKAFNNYHKAIAKIRKMNHANN